MAIEALKSASITNLDAAPIVPNTAGKGAAGYLWQVNDYATVSALASQTSTYKMVRLPTVAKVKSVVFESEAQGAGAFDIGVSYSDQPIDGTPSALAGTVIDANFFASAVAVTSIVNPTNVTNESGAGNYTLDKRNMPLWQALGLTVDPGGFFDIVCTVVSADITTGTGKMGISAEFIW